ncbi:MAG: hypothetical protein HRU19_04125 [Pseudobacteriovorax sp.]|nr:hypothetical protein [Pseudobacteriovorax sp.]
MKRFSMIYIFGLVVTTAACQTTTSKKSSFDSNKKASVNVHQTNGNDVLTELDRDTWVQIRNESKSEHKKLYAGLGAREWDVAIADARAYLENHPGDFVALKVLSTALAMKQNFALANYYAQMIEKRYPGQASTYNIQGLATLNKPGASYQDFQLAAQHFERSFETDSSQVASGLNLGHLHLESGNARSAKDVFRVVGSRCGGCNAAKYGYGLAASRLKEFEVAKRAFKDILDNDSDNLQAKYNMALVETFGFKEKRKAIAILAEVLETKDEKNLEIKRQANFLKRRLEAQVYAKSEKRPASEEAKELVAEETANKDADSESKEPSSEESPEETSTELADEPLNSPNEVETDEKPLPVSDELEDLESNFE